MQCRFTLMKYLNDGLTQNPEPRPRRSKKKARAQRGGSISYGPPPIAGSERRVSCTTFNILAPIYNWLDDENCREGQFRACWLSRNQKNIWSPKRLEQPDENFDQGIDGELKTNSLKQQAFGLSVKDAALFPPEVEKGIWPENYSLSDHAPLTVVFSPVEVSSSSPVC